MAIGLTGSTRAVGQELLSSSATAAHSPGESVTDGLGRKFRYVKAGASALVTGNVIQAPAQDTAHQALVVPAQTGILDKYGAVAGGVGAYALQVTVGASAVTANQYADGWLLIHAAGTGGAAIGTMYQIAGHLANAGSAGMLVQLTGPLQGPLPVLAGQNTVCLVANPYKGVIQAPTTLTGAVVGAAVYPLTAAEWGWIQTGGPAGVLTAGTPGVGLAVVVPGSAAGAVVVDGAASATPSIGYTMTTGVDAKAGPIMLTID